MCGRGSGVRRTVLTVALVGAVTILAGCDEMTMGGGGGGGDLGGSGGYYPDWGLYDPTQMIQDVIDYRWAAMDQAAAGWDEFIRQ